MSIESHRKAALHEVAGTAPVENEREWTREGLVLKQAGKVVCRLGGATYPDADFIVAACNALAAVRLKGSMDAK